MPSFAFPDMRPVAFVSRGARNVKSAPRLRRRDRTGFAPVSLLAATGTGGHKAQHFAAVILSDRRANVNTRGKFHDDRIL
jgi:hypothetical protein